METTVPFPHGNGRFLLGNENGGLRFPFPSTLVPTPLPITHESLSLSHAVSIALSNIYSQRLAAVVDSTTAYKGDNSRHQDARRYLVRSVAELADGIGDLEGGTEQLYQPLIGSDSGLRTRNSAYNVRLSNGACGAPKEIHLMSKVPTSFILFSLHTNPSGLSLARTAVLSTLGCRTLLVPVDTLPTHVTRNPVCGRAVVIDEW
eukprot:364180-Chlamydomonas_euryale.AAC.23